MTEFSFKVGDHLIAGETRVQVIEIDYVEKRVKLLFTNDISNYQANRQSWYEFEDIERQCKLDPEKAQIEFEF